MPEQGEKVFVLYKSERETDGIAIEALRNNDIAQCPNITSYSDRYFTTEQKKEMKLVPESMGLDTYKGNSFTIEEEKGVTLKGTQIQEEGALIFVRILILLDQLLFLLKQLPI